MFMMHISPPNQQFQQFNTLPPKEKLIQPQYKSKYFDINSEIDATEFDDLHQDHMVHMNALEYSNLRIPSNVPNNINNWVSYANKLTFEATKRVQEHRDATKNPELINDGKDDNKM